MSVINEKIVISKYKAYHTLYNKKIDFNGYESKVKNIIQHKEIIKDMKCTVVSKHVDVNLKLIIYYTYIVEQMGKSMSCSSKIEEDIFLRFYRKNFMPVPYETDFNKCELTAYLRNMNTIFDINLDYSSINIITTAFVIVNLYRERCIQVEDEKEEAINECFLNQVALSSDPDMKDAKNYFSNLENYSKKITRRIEELEEENGYNNEQLKRLEAELSKRTEEYLDGKRKLENISQECVRLTDRLKEMEEKYLKEQKKANLLEIENARNNDELKTLRKEKNALHLKLEKNNITLKNRIKLLIRGEDKH